MPRLYREAPINAIWEGSGNVHCLDVLRAISPRAADARRLFLRDRSHARRESRARRACGGAEGRHARPRRFRGTRPRFVRSTRARPAGERRDRKRAGRQRRRLLRFAPRRPRRTQLGRSAERVGLGGDRQAGAAAVKERHFSTAQPEAPERLNCWCAAPRDRRTRCVTPLPPHPAFSPPPGGRSAAARLGSIASTSPARATCPRRSPSPTLPRPQSPRLRCRSRNAWPLRRRVRQTSLSTVASLRCGSATR